MRICASHSFIFHWKFQAKRPHPINSHLFSEDWTPKLVAACMSDRSSLSIALLCIPSRRRGCPVTWVMPRSWLPFSAHSGGCTSFCLCPSHLQAILAVSQINSSAWLCAQMHNCWEVCIKELGNPCHSRSLLSNQFPWKPTYVGPDKLSALWVAFHWCTPPLPLFT